MALAIWEAIAVDDAAYAAIVNRAETADKDTTMTSDTAKEANEAKQNEDKDITLTPDMAEEAEEDENDDKDITMTSDTKEEAKEDEGITMPPDMAEEANEDEDDDMANQAMDDNHEDSDLIRNWWKLARHYFVKLTMKELRSRSKIQLPRTKMEQAVRWSRMP